MEKHPKVLLLVDIHFLRSGDKGNDGTDGTIQRATDLVENIRIDPRSVFFHFADGCNADIRRFCEFFAFDLSVNHQLEQRLVTC